MNSLPRLTLISAPRTSKKNTISELKNYFDSKVVHNLESKKFAL